MQKFLIRILCCFIPSKKLRHTIRKKYNKSISGYTVNGTNNKIYVDNTELKHSISGVSIFINGNNNTIHIPKSIYLENLSIRIDANNTNITISDTVYKIRNLHINACCGDNQSVFIGRNFHCFGVNIQLNEEKASVNIGNDCLFSNSISIWPTDGHSILDKKTGKILNHITQPVSIGDNCWIGEGVRILKNAQIPSNTIVGGGSVVAKKFDEEYTVIAGNPAKVIKHDVTWSHMNPMTLEKHLKNK
ncbi:MAG: acyltransferase [Alphaproteobacteria bacterium]|nr:acyltransferase [Alphaproteobacteria bacterium]